MMPGGDKEAYKALEPIVSKVAAQVLPMLPRPSFVSSFS